MVTNIICASSPLIPLLERRFSIGSFGVWWQHRVAICTWYFSSGSSLQRVGGFKVSGADDQRLCQVQRPQERATTWNSKHIQWCTDLNLGSKSIPNESEPSYTAVPMYTSISSDVLIEFARAKRCCATSWPSSHLLDRVLQQWLIFAFYWLQTNVKNHAQMIQQVQIRSVQNNKSAIVELDETEKKPDPLESTSRLIFQRELYAIRGFCSSSNS